MLGGTGAKVLEWTATDVWAAHSSCSDAYKSTARERPRVLNDRPSFHGERLKPTKTSAFPQDTGDTLLCTSLFYFPVR